MTTGSTMALPHVHDVLAPDGSEVRILLSAAGGSMAHFLLPAGQISKAVRHRTVEELWYVLSGSGEMWRSVDGLSGDIVPLSAGVSLTIPIGVSFQFRCIGDQPLAVVAVTLPPWPRVDEAEMVEGTWEPTVPPDDSSNLPDPSHDGRTEPSTIKTVDMLR